MLTAAAPVSIKTEMEIGRQVWPPGQGKERRGWGASLINSNPDSSLELPLARGALSSQLTQICRLGD